MLQSHIQYLAAILLLTMTQGENGEQLQVRHGINTNDKGGGNGMKNKHTIRETALSETK